MNVIVNTTRLKVPPENRRELFLTIRSLMASTQSVYGCIAYGCYVDLFDENSALLVGEWETEKALDNYLRSSNCAILRGAIELLANPSSVDFKLLSPIDGTDVGHPAENIN